MRRSRTIPVNSPNRDVLRTALELRTADWRNILRGPHVAQARTVLHARQLEPDHDLAEGNARAQACGLTGLGGFLRPRRPFGRLANDALGILVFVLTDCCCDSSDIEIVRLPDVLANSVQLVNDGVAPLHAELTLLTLCFGQTQKNEDGTVERPHFLGGQRSNGPS